MVNQLDMNKSFAIQNLRSAGYSERRIAQTLGVSRGAVRRHLAEQDSNGTKVRTGSEELPASAPEDSNGTKVRTGSDTLSEPRPESSSRSGCEPLRSVILAKLEQGLSDKRIHQDLVAEHGFALSYCAVNRFTQSLRGTHVLPFRRMEAEPGEQLQIDFGMGAKIPQEDGRLRRSYVFRAVLSHSRKGYSEAVWRMDTESLIRVLENTFRSLGGVVQSVVFDNAKCAVRQADWYDPELHPKLVDFCRHYGCGFMPTRVRTPRHKGKVERGIDYVQENALRGRSFATLAEQNEHLRQWESSVADTRIHGTTCKQVGALFRESELPALKPLPADRFAFYLESKRQVSRDGHISVDRAFYSVPPEYLGCEVWVRYDSRLVRIYDAKLALITTHTRQERGKFSTQRKHIASEKISPIERGLAYQLKKVQHLGPWAVRWAQKVVEVRGVEATRVLQGLNSLSGKYESSVIDRACQVAWGSGAWNYRVVARLAKQKHAALQETMEFMDAHAIIRPLSEYGQFVHAAVQGR